MMHWKIRIVMSNRYHIWFLFSDKVCDKFFDICSTHTKTLLLKLSDNLTPRLKSCIFNSARKTKNLYCVPCDKLTIQIGDNKKKKYSKTSIDWIWIFIGFFVCVLFFYFVQSMNGYCSFISWFKDNAKNGNLVCFDIRQFCACLLF